MSTMTQLDPDLTRRLRQAGWDEIGPITPDIWDRARRAENQETLTRIFGPHLAPQVGAITEAADLTRRSIVNALNPSWWWSLYSGGPVQPVLNIPQTSRSRPELLEEAQRLPVPGYSAPPAPPPPPPPSPAPVRVDPAEAVWAMLLRPQVDGGGGLPPQPQLPTPNYDLIRQLFLAAAPEAPQSDPRETWLIGLIGSMLGAEQRPGERLGAMFARMAGAGAQAGLRAHELRRQREDVGRRERQQHALRLAELESSIGEREYTRAFNEWRARAEDAYRTSALASQAEAARMRQALLLLQLMNAGASITPELVATAIAGEIARGRPVAGVPMEQIRQKAWDLLKTRPRTAQIARTAEATLTPNSVLAQELQAALGEVTLAWLNQLRQEKPEEFIRLMKALRGLRETRPRAGSAAYDLGLEQ